jgi:Flp pilus assembly protein TadD
LAPKVAIGYKNLAWTLAIAPAPWCDPKRAVELAKKAAEIRPDIDYVWNTLGVAFQSNGEWKEAITALNQAIKLRGEGRCVDYFPLAMANWQLGEKNQARSWFDKGVQRMDSNNELQKSAELRMFRAEAAALLGLNEENGKR